MTASAQVRALQAGEPACRPGSVRPLARGGGHPSGTAVAGSLVRSTREHRAGRPRSLAQGTVAPLLTLLRVGFTEPPQSPAALVVSYTTVSPLPPLARGRSVFCGTVPRVTPGRRYRPPCPVEPGPSSPGLRPARPPGRLTRAQDTPDTTGPAWRTEPAPANDASDSTAAATGASAIDPAHASSANTPSTTSSPRLRSIRGAIRPISRSPASTGIT